MEYNEKALANYIEKNFSEVKMVKLIVDSNMASDKIFTQAIIKDQDDVERFRSFTFAVSDIKKANRNFKIEEILKKENVEQVLYSDEQQKKIEKLRFEREYEKNLKTEAQIKIEEENNFQLNQRVNFNQMPGIITFVGDINKNGIRKYTVKLQDGNEHRFVAGKYLTKRKKQNLIEPPTDPVSLKIFNKHVKRFESMSTDRIIKIKNKMRLNYEEGYEFVEKQAALFVLQYRGHHKRKKINVNYDKNI